jgi:hypothetical protein
MYSEKINKETMDKVRVNMPPETNILTIWKIINANKERNKNRANWALR